MLGDPFTVPVRAKCADWPISCLTSHVMCALASHTLCSMCALHITEDTISKFFQLFLAFSPFLICSTQMLHAENRILQRQVICVDIEAEADNFGKLQLFVWLIVLVTLTDTAIRLNQPINQPINQSGLLYLSREKNPCFLKLLPVISLEL